MLEQNLICVQNKITFIDVTSNPAIRDVCHPNKNWTQPATNGCYKQRPVEDSQATAAICYQPTEVCSLQERPNLLAVRIYILFSTPCWMSRVLFNYKICTIWLTNNFKAQLALQNRRSIQSTCIFLLLRMTAQ